MDKTALFKLSYGLYIIGARDNDRNVGCVVNTVSQATSQPVTLTVCINKNNYTNACIKKTRTFTVSILSERINESVIGAFGFSSSRDKDKFSGIDYALTPSGLPYITKGVSGYIQCRVHYLIENYTHTIFIAEAQEAEKLSDEPPMTYEYYHKVIKGKTPKNASTYAAELEDIREPLSASYKCSVCGYEYPGSAEEFLKLPDDFQCPVCCIPKSMFRLR